VAPLVAGDPPNAAARRDAVDRREGIVEHDRVALELQVVETAVPIKIFAMVATIRRRRGLRLAG
jgi:hypothetical protein